MPHECGAEPTAVYGARMAPRRHDAIVLAGGRSSRLGGGDKLTLQREGRSLLSYAVAALPDAERIVVVGPPDAGIDDPRVTWCREDPPFAGPLIAITEALRHVAADTVVVLAGDQPAAAPAIPRLLAALAGAESADAAVLIDADGVRQPLTAAYRTAWLLERTAPAPWGSGMRSLLRGTDVVEVPDEWGAAADLDDAGDARRLGFHPDA